LKHIITHLQQSTPCAAQYLLGKTLVRKIDNHIIKLIITEVEAYDGPHDLACHARFGKTKRTEAMFLPAGHIYMYLIYGMYWMLNIVTGPKDYPCAILIRGTQTISGPGRLTKKLYLDKTHNKKILCKKTGLWIENNKIKILKKNIIKTPRIGVDYAGPIWAKKKYRFVLSL
jgi:DNA-3-methyladenine glycosylase